ncbi:MAG: START domain-containing protein [Bacteroidota bacterium]
MYHKILVPVILVCCFGFTSQNVHDNNDRWELKKDQNNIKIYVKKNNNHAINELKAVTNFSSSLNGLVAFVKDIAIHEKYIERCKSAYIIRNVNDSELYYYQETEAPWPVANRYGVIYYKIRQASNKTVVIQSSNILGLLPPKADMVEVPALKASWTFTPKANGIVEGEYYLYVNPGGNIPVWLINLFLVDGPYNTLLKMKKLLAQGKYQGAKSSYIKD